VSTTTFDIRGYVESRLDKVRDSAGVEITANCPRCGRWGGFYVNAETGGFVCFKCDFRGKNVSWLVAEVEGISHAEALSLIFRSSVKLRRRADVFTLGDRLRGLRAEGEVELGELEPVEATLPREFRPCWDGKAWRLPAYLKERRIKSDTARAWGLGFCRVGQYAGRLIIPIVCPGGQSFTARDMTGEQLPKYLNPPGADHGRLLIGWNLANLTGDICLVEGPLDAIRWYQHGIPALAVGGKHLHSDQLGMLFKLAPTQAVTVALDPEEKTAPLEVAQQLTVHFERVYIARLPDGVDPGDSNRTQAESAVENAVRYTGDRALRLKGKLESLKDEH
jgi:DNA primase